MTPEARTALERLGRDIARQRKEDEAQAALEQQRRAAAEREAALFRQAVQDTAPLRAPKRLERPAPRTIARSLHGKAPGAVYPVQVETREAPSISLSDGVDGNAGYEADDELCYLRTGFAPNTLNKLRRGDWPIQDQLDLHGQTRDEARQAVGRFLADSARRGMRCVRIVHGKGLGSANRMAVLKTRVPHWLKQSETVLGFVQARPADGGAGAILVLLAGQAP